MVVSGVVAGHKPWRQTLCSGTAIATLAIAGVLVAPAKGTGQTSGTAPDSSQIKMPEIVVTAPKSKPKPKRAARRPAPQSAATAAAAAPANATTATEAALDAKMNALDQARDNLLPKLGASTYVISRQAIETQPQGDNTPIDKAILQMPGVSYDSAVSNPDFHVRNEYANVQIRINGVVLPEGVSALGPFLDTNFVGSMSLLTGTLPAEYGLRTAGVLDITSRSFATPGGEVSLYGGSHQTVTPSFDYGGSVGNSEYFVTARGNWNDLGLENPTSNINAIHDETEQGKFFGYASTLLDESTRFSVISAISYSAFQIPNNLGQTPLGDFGPANYNSALLNENEYDTYVANIATLQKKGTDGDGQLSVYSRYASVDFVPDVFGDLVFNDVASHVTRESLLNGIQGDASYVVDNHHTLRFGFATSEEHTDVGDVATVLPVDPTTGLVPPGSAPLSITDDDSKVGWNLGAYIQDEWKLTDQLTLNSGLRFDQLFQYVDANQLSPRFALIYKPVEGTAIHAGFARYFTPPYQAQAASSDIALFANTTNAPPLTTLDDPVKPERSSYYDVGIDQTVLPGLSMGLDAYYKNARDMLDDGQFGSAVVLTQFNYAQGYSEGGEYKLKYNNGNFKAYTNFAYNITRAQGVESNQYLIEDESYLTDWHYTDDMQRMTGSAGASYRWNDTLFTTDLIYGSGLRDGFDNTTHAPPYTVVNVGVSHDFHWSPNAKPLTVRFDVVNLFDDIYELRSGCCIGEFAPQYGARRGYFIGLSQKL